MAARFDGAGGSLSRTTGMPSVTNFTITGWFYVTTDQTCMLMTLNNTSPNVDTAAGIAWLAGSTLEVWSLTGGAASSNTNACASRPATGTWNFFYLQCSGSGAGLLKFGWVSATGASFVTAATTLIATPTLTSLTLGTDVYSDPFSGRIQNVIVHDAVLGADELMAQRAQHFPTRWANINSWYPLIANSVTNIGIDYSGNGRNLTTTATVTIEDPPPLPWGMDSVINFGPIAAGTTFNQSALASTSPVAASQCQTGKLLLASTTPAKSLVRAISKALAASTAPVARLTRQATRTLQATTSPVASGAAAKVLLQSSLASTAPVAALGRQTGKQLKITTSPVAGVVRFISKTLAASTTPTKSFSAIKVILLSIQASTSPVASLKRQTGKALLAATAPLTALARLTAKVLRATTSPIASRGAGRALILRATTSPVASLVAGIVAALRGRTIATTITVGGAAPSTTISGLTGSDSSKELP